MVCGQMGHHTLATITRVDFFNSCTTSAVASVSRMLRYKFCVEGACDASDVVLLVVKEKYLVVINLHAMIILVPIQYFTDSVLLLALWDTSPEGCTPRARAMLEPMLPCTINVMGGLLV